MAGLEALNAALRQDACRARPYLRSAVVGSAQVTWFHESALTPFSKMTSAHHYDAAVNREGLTGHEARSVMEHKQVIVLRKDLNMRKGKMVAQGAHASMHVILNGARREGDVRLEFRAAVDPRNPRSW